MTPKTPYSLTLAQTQSEIARIVREREIGYNWIKRMTGQIQQRCEQLTANEIYLEQLQRHQVALIHVECERKAA